MAKENQTETVGKLVGLDYLDRFDDFDLTDVQAVIKNLSREEVIDIAHAEKLQQKSLYAADILIEYIARLVKMVSYLEAKINSTKNKISLEYKSADGKTTADMKKQAGEAAPEVEELALMLAKAKGSKLLLERKYEILLKSHHYYKDIANSQKKGMMSSSNSQSSWE